jgi:hypothetical protein
MASKLERVVVPVPFAGLDLTRPLHKLQPGFTDACENWLVHEDDLLRPRGPILWVDTLVPRNNADSADLAAGRWLFPVQTNHDVFHVAALDGTPPSGWRWQRFEPGYAGSVWTDSDYGRSGFYTVSSGTFTLHTVADQSVYFSPNWTQYRGAPWVISTHAESSDVSEYRGTEHPRSLLAVWQESTGDFVTSVDGSSPYGAQAVCSYAKRLWVGGGAIPGTTAATFDSTDEIIQPNTLWYTSVNGNPHATGTAADLNVWKEDVSTNPVSSFVVGEESPGDAILQLLATDRYMLILKRNSIWVLTGSGLDTFTLRRVADHGISDPRAACVDGNSVYFITSRGLSVYDGAEVTVLSDRIGFLGGVVGLTGLTESTLFKVSPNYLLLSTASTTVDAVAYLYHTPTGRWSRFTSPSIDTNAGVSAAINMGQDVFIPNFQAVFQSHIEQGGTLGTVVEECTDSEDSGGSALRVPYNLVLNFQPVRGHAPMEKLKLHRTGVEYVWYGADDTDDEAPLEVRVYNYSTINNANDGVALTTAYNLTLQEQDLDMPQFVWQDAFVEARDFYIALVRNTTVGTQADLDSGTRIRVYNAFVDVEEPAHRRYA